VPGLAARTRRSGALLAAASALGPCAPDRCPQHHPERSNLCPPGAERPFAQHRGVAKEHTNVRELSSYSACVSKIQVITKGRSAWLHYWSNHVILPLLRLSPHHVRYCAVSFASKRLDSMLFSTRDTMLLPQCKTSDDHLSVGLIRPAMQAHGSRTNRKMPLLRSRCHCL
jgi:hypothetical protein